MTQKGQILFIVSILVAFFLTTTNSEASSTVYKLDSNSSYQTSCDPSCRCSVTEPVGAHGTFTLVSQTEAPNAKKFKVVDVNLLIEDGFGILFLHGNGELNIRNGIQFMKLDLQDEKGNAHEFTSGPVVPMVGLPDLGIILFSNDGCTNSALEIHAAPVPTSEITKYSLTTSTTLIEGCFEKCECPISLFAQVNGSFGLISLGEIQYNEVFAVVNFAGIIPNDLADAQPIVIRGYGNYLLNQISDAAIQQLKLSLTIDNSPSANFDSGIRPIVAPFPQIQIQVDKTGSSCVDTVLRLDATPGL